MAQIRNYPVVSHFRSEPSMQVVRYRNGQTVRQGRGLAFWFMPLSTAVAELPLDDRQATLTFKAMTLDFQETFVQGLVTWRVVDPDALCRRIDFHLDLRIGSWAEEPLERVAGLLIRVSQEHALQWVAERPLEQVLAEGVGAVREYISRGLASEDSLAEMGLEIVSVRVAAVKPSAEMEKALQTPAREAMQQTADEALFQRRAAAVDKERAIAENELKNRIELARREEQLIEQQGANDRRRALEETQAERVRAESAAALARIGAEAEAENLRLVEGARAEVERQMMEVYGELPKEVLIGLAMRELAGKLEHIDHVNIGPDMLSPLLGDFLGAATERLGR